MLKWILQPRQKPTLLDERHVEPAPTKIIPRDLGLLGMATADTAMLFIEAVFVTQGPAAAAEAAAGYVEAYSRFVRRHPELCE